MLSGGERNRLLLARLFARPANVLVLDEPTNDLDIDSLELLENMLQDYTGTLLLVSHDRAFLDNVVTQTVAAEGDGRWREYVGGYTDWLRQRPQHARCADARDAARRAAVRCGRRPRRSASSATRNSASSNRCRPRSRSWKHEQRQLHAADVRTGLSSRRRRSRCAAIGERASRARDPDRRAAWSAGSSSRRWLEDREEHEARTPDRPPAIRIWKETAHRGGKGVSAIHGVPLPGPQLEELCSALKKKCGTGGTVKNGVIEIQGDHRDRLVEELKKLGYTDVKKAGG